MKDLMEQKAKEEDVLNLRINNKKDNTTETTRECSKLIQNIKKEERQ